jgi:CRP-like cAMP-binding protein
MINELATTYLFNTLDYDVLADVSTFSSRLHLLDGEVLIHENETENFDLFVLCAGSVEIISSSSPAVSGDVVISNKDMEVFGEISWITRRRRTATVRCRGEVDAVRIDGRAFMDYLESHPRVGFVVIRKVAELLSQRLVATDTLLKQILWNSTL